MDFEIRAFRNEDLNQVMAIEKASFPDPYSEPVFWWLRVKVGERFIVAETEKVVGYAISEIRGGRGHIISMAVSPGCRRAGVGGALLRESIARLAPKVKTIYLEVRQGNEAAIMLYEKFSFKKTPEVRKRYYPDGEDALIMARPSEVMPSNANSFNVVEQPDRGLESTTRK